MRDRCVSFGWLAAAAMAISTGCGGGGGSSPGSNSTVPIWAIAGDTQTIKRLSSTADHQKGNLDYIPSALAMGEGALWALSESGKLMRINKSTLAVEATIDISGGPRDVAVAGGAVWVATDPNSAGKPSLLRFDPETQQLLGTTEVGNDNDQVSELAVTETAVYALIENGFGVARIAADTGAVEKTVRLGAAGGYGYGEISVWGDALWVLDTYSDKLMRLNATSLEEEVGESVSSDLDGDLAAGSDKVYATSLDGEKAVVFDATTGKSVMEVPLGGRPKGRATLVTKAGVLLIGLADQEGGDLLMFDAKSAGEKGSIPAAFADDLVAE